MEYNYLNALWDFLADKRRKWTKKKTLKSAATTKFREEKHNFRIFCVLLSKGALITCSIMWLRWQNMQMYWHGVRFSLITPMFVLYTFSITKILRCSSWWLFVFRFWYINFLISQERIPMHLPITLKIEYEYSSKFVPRRYLSLDYYIFLKVETMLLQNCAGYWLGWTRM